MTLPRLAAYLLALVLGLALGWLTGANDSSPAPGAPGLGAHDPRQPEAASQPTAEPTRGSAEQGSRPRQAESSPGENRLARPTLHPPRQDGPLSFDDLPPSMRPEALRDALAGLDELLAEGDSELGFFELDCDRPPCVLVFDRPCDEATYGRRQGVEDLRAALGGTASLTDLQLFESRVVRDEENLFHMVIIATGEVVDERGTIDKAARLRFEEISSELVPTP